MVSISKFGDSAIKFTFDDSDHYLMGDGEITVPVNGLILVLDESNMATFKKIDGDPFISFNIADSNFSSKSDLETFYKENMVGSTGVTPEEVQTMIDSSISGLAESSAVTEEITAAVSGKADSSVVTSLNGVVTGHTADTTIHVTSNDKEKWNKVDDKLDASAYTPTDLSQYWTSAETENAITAAVSGKADTSAVTASLTALDEKKLDASAYTPTDLSNYYTKSQTSGATQISTALGDKADTSAVTESINAAVSGKADTSAVTASITAAVSGKQDTLIAGSGITIDSANTISCTVEGGGKAIVAGTNISVTTGATADTINCTLPFIIKSHGIAYNNTYGNIIIGNYNFNGGNSILTRGGNSGSSMNTDIIIAGDGNKFTGAATRMLIGGSFNEINNTSEGYSSGGGNGIIVGQGNKINHSRHNYVFGDYNSGSTSGTTQQEVNNFLLIFGERNKTNNTCESTFGRFNNSVSGSSTFGDSGNTLFSVGNGTADNARHNAFEIRQNGDIYITSGGTDIKLQDNLGGGGVTIDSALSSTSENPVQNKVIYQAIGDIETILAAI